MALSAISYLIGHLCVCVFSSNISSESMLLFGAEHCLPSVILLAVCVRVYFFLLNISSEFVLLFGEERRALHCLPSVILLARAATTKAINL